MARYMLAQREFNHGLALEGENGSGSDGERPGLRSSVLKRTRG